MSVWISIERKMFIRNNNDEKHDVGIVVDGEIIEINTQVTINEEFDLGNCLWAINNWFYRMFLNEYGNKKELENLDIYENEFFDRYISIEDIKKLMLDAEKCLKNHSLAPELFPYTKEVIEVYKLKNKDGSLKYDIAYSDVFFEDLKYVERLLMKIINEDDKREYEYTVSVG